MLHDPAGELAAKMASRRQIGQRTTLSLPGDPMVQNAIDWGKQNLADLTRAPRTCRSAGPTRASSSRRRWAPCPRRRGSAPASPTTRGSSVPTRSTPHSRRSRWASSSTIEGHLRALRDISDILNKHPAWWCTRRCPTAPSGSATTRGSRTPTARRAYDFNTDETVKFPSAVALIWRWTGDNRFRDEMYDFAKRNLHYVVSNLDADHDGWPEGLGNVERTGWGRRSSTTPSTSSAASTTWRTWPSPSTTAPLTPGRRTWPAKLRQRFDGTWWYDTAQQYADSLSRRATRSRSRSTGSARRRWRRSLHVNGQTVPGPGAVRPRDDGAGRAGERLLQRRSPVQPGPVPHRLRRRSGPARARRSSTA